MLEALKRGNRVEAEDIGGFRIPEASIFSPNLIAMRLGQLEADPAVLPWLLQAIVHRKTNTMCGRIGFHSRPGPEDLRDIAPDGVELGYEVGKTYRRQGFAKEAALLLMKWAFEAHNQQSFVLSIDPENQASMAMGRSLGFQQIGSHVDPRDGLELYLERRITAWPDDWKLAHETGA